MIKLLTVFGATGQQGGALIDSVLGNPELSSLFRLRGITRDAWKPASIALKNKGVEVVEADLDVPSTLEKAVSGSYAVFGVTNYWEKISAEVEESQGKAIADAAVAAGATQIIWSSLPRGEKTADGDFTAPKQFVSKADVEDYIRTLNIKSMFFMPGWFMQNHFETMPPKKLEDGTFGLFQPWTPSTTLPLIDIRDIGKFIGPALLDPDRYHGQRFTCATAFYSLAEMVETWTTVTGTTVKLENSRDAVDYGKMSKEQREDVERAGYLIMEYGYFGPTGQADVDWTLKQATEKLRTWEDFVRDYEPWFT